jgi:hypothetical protein
VGIERRNIGAVCTELQRRTWRRLSISANEKRQKKSSCKNPSSHFVSLASLLRQGRAVTRVRQIQKTRHPIPLGYMMLQHGSIYA